MSSFESPVDLVPDGGIGEIPVSETAFWAAFHAVPYIGPTRLERLRQRFPTLQAAWQASTSELKGVLDERAAASLVHTRQRIDPESMIADYDKLGVAVISQVDARYPASLRHISGAPPVIYVRGNLLPADERAVAIVGTRRASAYGRQVARQFASDLAAAAVTVVSGLARGIDIAAHEAAIQAGGRTIAVLGSGPDIIYPPEHRRLVEAIIDGKGAIVSDYPPGRKPDARNFPARNRIISGLSRGVLIIEAPARSGALITADFAADQSREVFVVPAGILSPTNAGGHALLRDGARIVTSAADLLDDLRLSNAAAARATQVSLPFDSPLERRLHALLTGEGQHIDDLAAMTQSPISEVSAALQLMELQGQVRNAGAHHYVRG